MSDTMHHRLTLALTPLIHHGIATPEEAATRVLEVMREPTVEMVDAYERADLAFVYHGYQMLINAALSGGR